MYHGPLRALYPASRINDDLILTKEHFTILNQHAAFFTNNFVCETIPDPVPNSSTYRFNTDFLANALVYVVTETVAAYPHTFFSEKTWRAMITGLPFMLVGAKHSVKKLKELGYRTFDAWWSEEYDNLDLAADRIEAVVHELKKLSTLTQQEMQQMRNEMQPVIEHNFNHLKTHKQQDLDNIQKILSQGN